MAIILNAAKFLGLASLLFAAWLLLASALYFAPWVTVSACASSLVTFLCIRDGE